MNTIENFVHIEGNLATDVELHSLPSGDAVCNLVIAQNERIQVEGQWQDGAASYFDCPVYGKLAEGLPSNLTKGDRVTVEGKLRQRVWVDKATGEKRYKIEIVTRSVSKSLRFAGSAPRVSMVEVQADEEPFSG